jgi:4-hydroxybenzoate polyprenyltransferase
MAGMNGVSSRVLSDLRETGEMIAFKHTIFALPFAVVSLITAASPSWPSLAIWSWVALAMVSARTAAMSFNRLADHDIDADNPRTAARALPAGRLGRPFAWTVTAVSAALFLIAAGALNPLCLVLAPPALAVLLGYSYTKRFTATSHLVLGFSLGIAPIGAWIAVVGGLAWTPLVLGAAVCFWVAGFDVMYSMQDEKFDRNRGLHSLPARIGGQRALRAARCLHLMAFVGFFAFAIAAGGGPIRIAAVAVAGLLLAWQHRLVSADNLENIDAAFFSSNGLLALVMAVLFVIARFVES